MKASLPKFDIIKRNNSKFDESGFNERNKTGMTSTQDTMMGTPSPSVPFLKEGALIKNRSSNHLWKLYKSKSPKIVDKRTLLIDLTMHTDMEVRENLNVVPRTPVAHKVFLQTNTSQSPLARYSHKHNHKPMF